MLLFVCSRGLWYSRHAGIGAYLAIVDGLLVVNCCFSSGVSGSGIKDVSMFNEYFLKVFDRHRARNSMSIAQGGL